jgi:mono/diheme cytochrome c family protein
LGKLIGIAAIVCSIIAVLVITGSAQAQDGGNALLGDRLARKVCAECHLVVNRPGLSINRDAPTFEEIAKTPGLTSTALTVMLQTSHRTMPNIVIEGDDLKNIIAYILSLKESN